MWQFGKKSDLPFYGLKDDEFPNFRIFQIKDIVVLTITLKSTFKIFCRFRRYVQSKSLCYFCSEKSNPIMHYSMVSLVTFQI